MSISVYYKRLTAWLGIIAILLLVCAPTISHWTAASMRLDLPFCAPSSTEPHASRLTSYTPSHDYSPASHPLSAMLNDCGYCDLLIHKAALPSVAPTLPPVLNLVLLTLQPAAQRSFTPIGAFPSGRPRGPPNFS